MMLLASKLFLLSLLYVELVLPAKLMSLASFLLLMSGLLWAYVLLLLDTGTLLLLSLFAACVLAVATPLLLIASCCYR